MLTVRVDVWAAAPLIATEVGFRLQVGMSLTPFIDVVTSQLNFTVPLNPFVPTTLIVPVFPVVAPGAIDKVVVPPLPAVNAGSGATLSEISAEAVNEPEVPVMVTVTALDVKAAESLAVKVIN